MAVSLVAPTSIVPAAARDADDAGAIHHRLTIDSLRVRAEMRDRPVFAAPAVTSRQDASALTDRDVRYLADPIGEMSSGQDASVFLVAVSVVLLAAALIGDMLGFTHLFPTWNKPRQRPTTDKGALG